MVAASASKRRQAILSVATVVAIAVVAALTWALSGADDHRSTTADSSTTVTSAASGQSSSGAPGAVPAHVLHTLALIDAGTWPEAADAPGTRGGDIFRNSEGNLPATDGRGRRITYREWDVNPKEPGRSRDAERIVTGGEGSAWYTADHYRTFVKIRGPDL
ncbi:ribonuclease domain-containing protein [Gordonia sp. SL306]|uniref:ribonuclease domain-containing protein n=1 Tax=Gordonia sp. SL306 TaxID=2995145 RepID=UPI00226F5A35|nr:ribonuclease domain-containing protein [Gordonia sp. SL306]WAC53780.1 guanine-specific ribonuclease N1 and T1 [Gordonia sp. SL306]